MSKVTATSNFHGSPATDSRKKDEFTSRHLKFLNDNTLDKDRFESGEELIEIEELAKVEAEKGIVTEKVFKDRLGMICLLIFLAILG